MDAKILRQSLKEAKEAYKNCKYQEAIKLCKAILREERNNYMALVLFGAALQETEQKSQAPNAYRKAVDSDPTQPLAWQGLVSFYEKYDSEMGKVELLTAYQELLKLESDEKKVLELTNKLAAAAQNQGQVELVVEALLKQQTVLHGDQERLLDTWCRIASILSSSPQTTEIQSEQLEEALSKIINNSASVVNMENLGKYLGVLYKRGKLDLLAEWSTTARSIFPKAEFPMEWVCRAYNKFSSKENEKLQKLIPQFCDDLLAINEFSGLALLAKGILYMKKGQITEARDFLTKATAALPTSVQAWELLAKCHARLYNSEDAEKCVKLATKLLLENPNKDRQSNLQYILMKALSRSNQNDKLLLAVSKCKELLLAKPNDSLALEYLVLAYNSLKHRQEAESALATLKATGEKTNVAVALEALLLAQQGKESEVSALLRQNNLKSGGLNTSEIVAKIWYELGNFYLEIDNQSNALLFFLKAAKVDPLFCLPFSRLADYYRLHCKDLDRARRCYQKALRLNPRCEEAGIGLSDIYREQNDTEANLDLLTRSSIGGTASKWTCLRLGLLHLQMGNTDEAINQFLATLRTDPSNSLCWESLGDAYEIRGSYTAAIKAFQKVLEYNPNSLYAAIQIANVKLLLGQLSEAEEEFKLVLKGCSDYVPALKGLGETYLFQAKDYQTRQMIGRCRDKCEDALTILTRAAKLQLNLACVWKLMGDACILPCDLGEHSYLHVCSSLLGAKAEEQHPTKVDCTQLLQLAARCYCRAISLDKDDNLVWHDLAVSYLTQARHFSAQHQELLRKALAAVQQACQLTAANTSHWNLLGVIAAGLKQYKLAQHAFIRAIQVSSGNVQAWSNLGTLYLCLGDVNLAHQAYAAAQRTEPSFVECWIGQALIAERTGYKDTMDLFRHSTQLSTHPESGLGYAHWVCSSFPKQQQESHAWRQTLAAVADELIWYTGQKSQNSCAHNLLGLVLERQGLLRGAAVSFEKALEVALTGGGDNADLPRTNLARVLISLGRNAEAVEHLKALSEPSFHSQCLLAFAYFKDGKFQDSFTTYDSAWHWLAQDDAQKSHILVAKAAMAYMFKGSEGAKPLLFQCAQLKPVSVHGLFSTCAIGILHKELQLSKLVLKELQPYVDDTKYMADIALFQAYTHFLQRQWPESIRGLSKVVHRHPDQAALWLALAVLLLNMYPDAPAKSSAPCAGAALCLGRNTMDISRVQSLVTLSHLQASNVRKSLIEAQRAVHLYPDQAEGWAVLVAAVLPRCIAQESKKQAMWLCAIVGLVRRRQDTSSRALTQWLSNIERKTTLLCEQLE